MPTIALRSIGLQGLQKDSMEQDIPASGITTGENVRILDNALTSWSSVIEQISFLDTEELLFADGLYRERSLLSGLIVILADETLMAFDGGFSDAFNIEGQVVIYFYDTDGLRTNIGPAAPMQTTEQWHGVRVGEIYLINNDGADLPHAWFVNEDPLGAFVILPGWPTNYKARFMSSLNNVIVAGGLIQDDVEVHYRIKWSHPVSPGDTTTFWDFTDPTILAGESPLITNAREMVALSPLKDLMMIYFDHAVFRMSFVGGTFVMEFEMAFTDDGAVSSRSMVSVDGMAYVFGYNDVYSHDGYIKTSITDKRMTRYIQNSINPERPVDVVYFSLYNELQFLTRTPSALVPVDGDRVFVYNLIHNAWTEADVTVNNVPAIGLLFTGPGLISDNSWDQVTLDWDNSGALTWAGAFQSPERDKLYALSKLNHVIYDWAPDGFGLGEAITTFSLKTRIEHTHIDMDDGGESVGNKIVYINRVYPQLQGFGTVQFRFGVHETAQAPVEWIETRLFKIAKVDQNDPLEEAADYACDVRMAGRYIAYELTILPGAEFSFGGVDIEVAMAGEV